nr:hypothetical protein CFP56_00656 [Quercus suber]
MTAPGGEERRRYTAGSAITGSQSVRASVRQATQVSETANNQKRAEASPEPCNLNLTVVLDRARERSHGYRCFWRFHHPVILPARLSLAKPSPLCHDLACHRRMTLTAYIR